MNVYASTFLNVSDYHVNSTVPLARVVMYYWPHAMLTATVPPPSLSQSVELMVSPTSHHAELLVTSLEMHL